MVDYNLKSYQPVVHFVCKMNPYRQFSMRTLVTLVISFAVASWIISSVSPKDVAPLDQLVAITLLSVLCFFPADGLLFWVGKRQVKQESDIRDIVLVWIVSAVLLVFWVAWRF